MKNYQKVLSIIFTFIILINLSACSSKSNQEDNSKNGQDVSNSCVATIADEKVTIPEYTFYLKCAKKDIEGMADIKKDDKEALKKFWATKIAGDDPVVTCRNNALDAVKELKILLIHAKQDNAQLTQSDLDKVKSYMDKAVKDNGNGDRAKAEEKIKEEYGVNLSQYEAIYKDYVLAYDNYANSLINKVEISDQAVKDYYDKNINSYDKVTVKHILILTQDASTSSPLPADKISEKEKLAQEIYNKVKSGANFDILVKQYSEDPGSMEKGGSYTFGKGEMVKEFEDWAFKAKEGDIGLVKSKYGFHIIKFIRKETFETQKADIKHELQQNEYNTKLDNWKKDNKFELKINQEVLNSIKIV